MTTLPPHTRLNHGDYTIHDTAGSPGGFGITYRASWVSMSMEVAIKELFVADSHLCSRIPGNIDVITSHDKLGEFREYIEKFKDEAKRLIALHHDNVVRVHDFFEENNTAYIAMEYLSGGSLYDLVEKKHRLTEQEALAIMKPLCQSVAMVHDKGILHRDISPENILFRTAGVPVLIDFGLAREHISRKTKTLAAFRDGYSPLEAYSAEGAREKQSDIYSLGAVLYFMVTGEDPPAATELAQGAEELRFSGDVSKTFQQAIIRAMQTKIANRYGSALEILEVLQTGGEAPPANHAGTFRQTENPTGINPVVEVVPPIVLGAKKSDGRENLVGQPLIGRKIAILLITLLCFLSGAIFYKVFSLPASGLYTLDGISVANHKSMKKKDAFYSFLKDKSSSFLNLQSDLLRYEDADKRIADNGFLSIYPRDKFNVSLKLEHVSFFSLSKRMNFSFESYGRRDSGTLVFSGESFSRSTGVFYSKDFLNGKQMTFYFSNRKKITVWEGLEDGSFGMGFTIMQ